MLIDLATIQKTSTPSVYVYVYLSPESRACFVLSNDQAQACRCFPGASYRATLWSVGIDSFLFVHYLYYRK